MGILMYMALGALISDSIVIAVILSSKRIRTRLLLALAQRDGRFLVDLDEEYPTEDFESRCRHGVHGNDCYTCQAGEVEP